MEERTVLIRSEGYEIEGLLDDSDGEKAMLVTHPHPLYGGDMHNNVVESAVLAYKQHDYTTLRFNFRGVGRSGGSYADGIGEQEDVRAALDYLHKMGKTSIDLAGYSFGAWVNALGLDGFVHAERMIMISPPVGFMDFSFLEDRSKIRLVITGSADDIADPAMIKEMIPRWNPELIFEIIRGADHFYSGKTGEIEAILESFLGING